MPDSGKDRLIKYLEVHSRASGPELCRHLGISRQVLSNWLRPLIAEGKVVKSGSTRAARYYLPEHAPESRHVSRTLPLPGADESRAWDEVAVRLNVEAILKPHVADILRYAFTEMLNNAIEHSRSDKARFEVRIDGGRALFQVRDRGIGVFHSIADKFGFDDEHAAMVELVKGRTTTMPDAHSGEGIFFTSKAADLFQLRSHRIKLEWNRARDDTFVSDERFIEGTSVQFMVRRDTRRRLDAVFSEFAPEEYDFSFERTRVLVKFVRKDYVSRSEARRLTANLEKFREVILDFAGVRSVGQGFADEVCRVFATRHPDTNITVVNASNAVSAMLSHAGARIADGP